MLGTVLAVVVAAAGLLFAVGFVPAHGGAAAAAVVAVAAAAPSLLVTSFVAAAPAQSPRLAQLAPVLG